MIKRKLLIYDLDSKSVGGLAPRGFEPHPLRHFQMLQPERNFTVEKVDWSGKVISIQPRIRLNRSFDERNHGYLGFSLRIEGAVSGNPQTFWVGIGKAAQTKYEFQCGGTVNGKAHPVQDSRIESV
ncbi:MAG: hypothetical protein DRR42_23090, partial [Gammaproteobacteria bacterium]